MRMHLDVSASQDTKHFSHCHVKCAFSLVQFESASRVEGKEGPSSFQEGYVKITQLTRQCEKSRASLEARTQTERGGCLPGGETRAACLLQAAFETAGEIQVVVKISQEEVTSPLLRPSGACQDDDETGAQTRTLQVLIHGYMNS